MIVLELLLINYIGLQIILQLASEEVSLSKTISTAFVYICAGIVAALLDNLMLKYCPGSLSILIILLESYLVIHIFTLVFKNVNYSSRFKVNTYCCALIAFNRSMNYNLYDALLLSALSGIIMLVILILLKMIAVKKSYGYNNQVPEKMLLIGIISLIYSAIKLCCT